MKCKIPSCKNPLYLKEMCTAHYLRKKRYGRTHVVNTKNKGKTCKLKGCKKQVYAKLFCLAHYSQSKTDKDPSLKRSTFKHGGAINQTRTPTYISWCSMKERCYRVRSSGYKNYGGRGITVCVRWKNSYPNFLKDMGPRPKNHTLDRIDPDKNYTPSNCRWATAKQQNNNKRKSRAR